MPHQVDIFKVVDGRVRLNLEGKTSRAFIMALAEIVRLEHEDLPKGHKDKYDDKTFECQFSKIKKGDYDLNFTRSMKHPDWHGKSSGTLDNEQFDRKILQARVG